MCLVASALMVFKCSNCPQTVALALEPLSQFNQWLFPVQCVRKGRGIESTYLQILSSCSCLLQYGHHCWLPLRLTIAIDSTTTNQKWRPHSLCKLIHVPQMAKGLQDSIQKAESGPRLRPSVLHEEDRIQWSQQYLFNCGLKGVLGVTSSLLQVPSQDHQIILPLKHVHSLCKSFYWLTHHQDKNLNSWMWGLWSCLLWPPCHHPFPALHANHPLQPHSTSSASCSRAVLVARNGDPTCYLMSRDGAPIVGHQSRHLFCSLIPGQVPPNFCCFTDYI